MKTFITVCTILLLSSSPALGKICWKQCSSSPSDFTAVDIIGCHRRPSPDGIRIPRFRCEGSKGPPCFVRRGDRATLKLKFVTDVALNELTQDAVWVTPVGVELPWAGMDHDACKYSNHTCGGTTNDNDYTGLKTVSVEYPIQILKAYPDGKFNIKWRFYTKENNKKKEVGCFLFAIKIV